MSNRKMDGVSRTKGSVSWLLMGAVALPVIVLTIGLSAATAYALLAEGPSAVTGPAEASVAPPADAPAVVAAGGVSPTATLPAPTDTPVPPVPTPTAIPGLPSLILEPADASNPVGTQHTVTAHVIQDGVNLEGEPVAIFVFDGPNVDEFVEGLTDADGHVALTYTSNGEPGTDDIGACIAVFATDECTNFGTDANPVFVIAAATKDWVEPTEPTPTAAVAVPTATVAAATLPGVGSGATTGSSSGATFWAVVAGIGAVLALGTAGVASLRRRMA